MSQSVAMKVHTEELESTPDLVETAAAARAAGREVILIERSVPDAVSVVGIGRALEIVSAPGGVRVEDASGRSLWEESGGSPMDAAARAWRKLAADLAVHPHPALPGTGPVALGGFAFNPAVEPAEPWSGFPGLLLRVPELALTRVRGRTFVTRVGDADADLLDAGYGFEAPAARGLEVTAVRNPLAWTAAVEGAAARLRAGEASKVVLARDVMAHGDGAIAAARVARALRAAYPSCYTYMVTGADGTALIGASPELLVRRAGRSAVCEPMGGSIARGADDEEDQRLAGALMASRKDRAEHEAVAAHVAQALAGIGARVTAPDGPQAVRFTNIQHLATTILAEFDAPVPSALDLAACLHPTPAIGGVPTEAALAIIAELEGMERGWYAGGVGWIDARGDGEFAVAIRCGLLWEDGARLYAGVGVMPDSDPAQELEETEVKFRALLGALTAG
jgi:salicylate biosynthesis isochorismate synthase/menaquinone-specific isochorismate synthase